MKANLAETETAMTAMAAIAAMAAPPMSVSGAFAPDNRLGNMASHATTSALAKVDALGCCKTGLPFHFAMDCPLDITASHTAGPTDAIGAIGATGGDPMIDAIVSDLTASFKYSAQTHDLIGTMLTPVSSSMAVEAAA